MKKIIIALVAVLGMGTFYSCSDMLDTDSDRLVIDPGMGEKIDSMYYAMGILKALQDVTDQYYLQGEMRGDLVDVVPGVTDKNLQALANFSASTDCKYDSAYLYYRIINNCNYYIAHRDTNLFTGAEKVVMPEYVAIKAIRAWTYMQLARNYGSVPFVLEPLTKISQIEEGTFENKNMEQIAAVLLPDLEQYTGYHVPIWGTTDKISGMTPTKLFMPVDLVMADLYLETNQYDKAIRHYVTYLAEVASDTEWQVVSYASSMFYDRVLDFDMMQIPNGSIVPAPLDAGGTSFSNMFGSVKDNGCITAVNFPANSESGSTSQLPRFFGYDYYGQNRKLDDVQIVMSAPYKELIDTTCYYFQVQNGSKVEPQMRSLGDARTRSLCSREKDEDTGREQIWISKLQSPMLYLYRPPVVWLKLAEAFNRAGYPDVAFAILKDGIFEEMLSAPYMTPEGVDALGNVYGLLKGKNLDRFNKKNAAGVHARGGSLVKSFDRQGNFVKDSSTTLYQMDTVVAMKLDYLVKEHQVNINRLAPSKQDTINAIEDLIVDEMAMEAAFEGTRYYDLMRVANHKNADNPYGANFGSLWLKKKLAYKNPVVDLSVKENWFLPFK